MSERAYTKSGDSGDSYTPIVGDARAGMDIERARADFPETGPELSPSVPTLPLPSVRSWEILSDRFPFGAPRHLAWVDAPSYAEARRIAESRHPGKLIVKLTARKA